MEVFPEIFKPSAANVAALLLDLLESAELQLREAAGLRFIYPGRNRVANQLLVVVPQFLVQLLFRSRPPKPHDVLLLHRSQDHRHSV